VTGLQLAGDGLAAYLFPHPNTNPSPNPSHNPNPKPSHNPNPRVRPNTCNDPNLTLVDHTLLRTTAMPTPPIK